MVYEVDARMATMTRGTTAPEGDTAVVAAGAEIDVGDTVAAIVESAAGIVCSDMSSKATERGNTMLIWVMSLVYMLNSVSTWANVSAEVGTWRPFKGDPGTVMVMGVKGVSAEASLTGVWSNVVQVSQ